MVIASCTSGFSSASAVVVSVSVSVIEISNLVSFQVCQNGIVFFPIRCPHLSVCFSFHSRLGF